MSPGFDIHDHPNGSSSTGGTNGAVKPTTYSDGFGTRAIHVGSDPDPTTGAVIPPLSLSTTYKQDGVGNHKVRPAAAAL
jgi:cystathionine gamma-lyase